jgi:hypothetical protein
MNCSRCNTTLPDLATFCPTCGSSTRTELPTFSYLPPGTPPWPISIPQELSYKGKVTPSGAEPAGTKLEIKPRRSLRGILIIAAVLLLTPLIGAGITIGNLYTSGQLLSNSGTQPAIRLPQSQNTPSAQGTPAAQGTPVTQGNRLPTPTSFQQSVGAPKVGVSLKYPTNWVEDAPQLSSTTSILRLHPQQQLGIQFIIGRFTIDATQGINNADDVNQANLQGFSNQSGVHNFQILQNSVAQRTIGGATWPEQDASYQDNNGNAMHFATISVQHKKLYYTILLLIPDTYYDEAMQKYIQPMLDSLQFVP